MTYSKILINYNSSSEFLCGSWSTWHCSKLIPRFTPGFRLLKKGWAVMLQETILKTGKILRGL